MRGGGSRVLWVNMALSFLNVRERRNPGVGKSVFPTGLTMAAGSPEPMTARAGSMSRP
jgi:hypothetical protein